MAQLPKGGLVRGHDKPIHGSCAIYFPGGIYNLLILYGYCVFHSLTGWDGADSFKHEAVGFEEWVSCVVSKYLACNQLTIPLSM